MLFWYLINQKSVSTTACKYLPNQHFHKCVGGVCLVHLLFPSLFIADDIFTCVADIVTLFVLQEVPATAHYLLLEAEVRTKQQEELADLGCSYKTSKLLACTRFHEHMLEYYHGSWTYSFRWGQITADFFFLYPFLSVPGGQRFQTIVESFDASFEFLFSFGINVMILNLNCSAIWNCDYLQLLLLW